MKANVIISRVGQIIILAIAFMACVGWNQAAGLQNNISSITRKRIKDIVQIRYILPYRSLHNVPSLYSNTSDIAFDTQSATNNLNNSILDSAGKQNEQFCRSAADHLLLPKQTQADHASFAVEKASSFDATAFYQSKQSSIADAFHDQGYFSGFTNSSANYEDYSVGCDQP